MHTFTTIKKQIEGNRIVSLNGLYAIVKNDWRVGFGGNGFYVLQRCRARVGIGFDFSNEPLGDPKGPWVYTVKIGFCAGRQYIFIAYYDSNLREQIGPATYYSIEEFKAHTWMRIK